MATYSYSIETKIPLTSRQQADFRRGGSVPDSVRRAADNAATALANSTFGSSWTPGSVDVAFVKNGNYIKSTSITSPSEVPAALLPLSIAPVPGAVNRLVEVRAPAPNDAPATAIVEGLPAPQTPPPGPDITTLPVVATPPAVQPIVVPTPVVETTPIAPAPVAFEPLTVGGRILAPAEFEGAADRLVVNPPPNTNPNAAPDPNTGGVADLFTPPTTAPEAAPPGDNDATGGAGTNVNQEPPTTAPAAVFVPPGPETEPNPPPPDTAVPPGVSTAAATNRAQGQSTDQTRVNQPLLHLELISHQLKQVRHRYLQDAESALQHLYLFHCVSVRKHRFQPLVPPKDVNQVLT
jgi:hypothetical protein